jgi:F-type H+-transporting ATPase subunit delta
MPNSILSKRYAKALFDLATTENASDKVFSDFTEIQKLLEENIELREVIQNPVISKKDRHGALSAILKKLNASNIVERFISVLIYNGRLSLLPQAINAYFEMEKAYRGQITAHVTSATALSTKQIKEIEKTLGSKLNKVVKIEPTVDNSIIGGVIVRIGSKMIDASISGKLDQIQILSKQAIAS